MQKYLYWTILASLLALALFVAFNMKLVPIVNEQGNIVGQGACFYECTSCYVRGGQTVQYRGTYATLYPRGMPDCD